MGAHMPLDVIGGAGLGILIGEIGRWIEVLLRRSEPAPALRPSHLGAVGKAGEVEVLFRAGWVTLPISEQP